MTARVGLRLLRLAAPFAGRMALGILLGVATVGAGLGLMTTSAYLIARAALQPSIATLQVAIVGVRFFGIARGVLRYLERLVAHDATFRLLARLRTWFYAALEPLAPARLGGFRSGDLLARAVADVESLENFYLRALAPPLVALLSAGIALALVGAIHVRLALVLLPFLLFAGAGLPCLARVLGREPGRRLVRVRAELNAVLVDAVQGAGDLLAAGAGGRHLARVEQLGCEMGAHQGRLARVGSLGEALGGLAVNGATLAVVAAGIPLVRAGRVDGVFLAVVAMAAISAFEAILPLPAAFGQLEESLEAASRLVALVDADPAVVDPPQPQPLPAAPGVLAALPRSAPLLQVEGLAFAYEGDGADLATGAGALRGVDLCVPLGGLVAVVGPSGAGKSTLVNLLLRFWDYGQGWILLAGRDVRACAAADVRRLVSVVSQHTHLFNGTVRDNLLLASPGGDEEALVRAARQARIHEFVASLPHGYDTWIGEQGLRLSAGQRRRLAIARAILQDAPLLLLDEPTANLDALTERAVIGSLLALAGHASSGGRRATLWVTHRLAGLEAADEIVVLREGRVVERGRHHDLVAASDGLYSRMWQLQNQVLPGRLPDST